jgi:hypothetical protein
MTVTDVWRLSQYHKLIKSKKDEYSKNVLTIKQFTGVLAKQIIKITMSYENEADFLSRQQRHPGQAQYHPYQVTKALTTPGKPNTPMLRAGFTSHPYFQ